MASEPLLTPTTARPLKTTILDGKYIRLQPVDPEADCQELFEASSGSHAWIWRFLLTGPYEDISSFKAYLQSLVDQAGVGFTVVDKPSGRKVGIVNYINIVPANRCLEIGGIWYTPEFHRTYANTESSYLLIRHAIEDLGYRRVEWKCDNLNEPSKTAATKLGFVYEGLFRQHMIVKGKNRDTAWFSIIDLEWPAIKRKLEDKIHRGGSGGVRDGI